MYTCLALVEHWAHSFRISKFSSANFVYCVPQRDFPFCFKRGADSEGEKLPFQFLAFLRSFLQFPCSTKAPVLHTGCWQCQRRHSCYHAWLLAIDYCCCNELTTATRTTTMTTSTPWPLPMPNRSVGTSGMCGSVTRWKFCGASAIEGVTIKFAPTTVHKGK